MTVLQFRDDDAAADLRTFAARARRLDAAAALRLVARGEVLAVYAGALHGGGGPTVLGLRTHGLAGRLDGPAELDVTVPAAALLDRLAAVTSGAGAGSGVQVPDVTAPQVAWAGLLPPQAGWSFEGLLGTDVLAAAAVEGIGEVASGTPAAAGSAAVARLRALVWGRDLPGTPGLPAGVAFAADAFGFLPRGGEPGADHDRGRRLPAEAITLHRVGAWWRLSTTRGHVLARTGLLF